MALLANNSTLGLRSNRRNQHAKPVVCGAQQQRLKRVVLSPASLLEGQTSACPFAGTAAYNAIQSTQQQHPQPPSLSEVALLRGPGWSVLPQGNTADLPEPQGKRSWSPLQFVLGDFPQLQQGEVPFLLEMFSSLGPVFRLRLGTMPMVAVLQHDTIKSLLEHGDGKVVAFWSPPALDAFTSAESKANMETPAARMAQRKTLAPGFSRQALRQVMGKVEAICRRRLDSWAAAGVAIDLAKEGRELSFDFSTELLVDFDVPDDQRAAMKDKIDRMFRAMIAPPVNLPFSTFNQGVQAKQELTEEIKRLIASRDKAAPGGDSRAAGSSAFELILQALRENQAKGGMLSPDTVAQSGISLLLAGTDTSGGGVTATLAMLAMFPEVMQKLRDEQRQVVERCGPGFTLAALDAMPWAEAVIKESLRLAPPAGVVMRKTLVDLEIHGRFVPAGSLLYLSTFAASNLDDCSQQRHGRRLSALSASELQQLGTEWHTINHKLLQREFRPERWLKGQLAEQAGDDAAARKESGLLTFGVGPHTCLGMSLFFVEAKVLLAMLARDYALTAEAPSQMAFSMTLLAQLASNAGSRVRFAKLPKSLAAAGGAGGEPAELTAVC